MAKIRVFIRLNTAGDGIEYEDEDSIQETNTDPLPIMSLIEIARALKSIELPETPRKTRYLAIVSFSKRLELWIDEFPAIISENLFSANFPGNFSIPRFLRQKGGRRIMVTDCEVKEIPRLGGFIKDTINYFWELMRNMSNSEILP